MHALGLEHSTNEKRDERCQSHINPRGEIEERAAQFGILPIVTEEPRVSCASVVRMSWRTDVGKLVSLSA